MIRIGDKRKKFLSETQERVKSIFTEFPIPKKIPLSVFFGVLVVVIFWTFAIISITQYEGIYNPFIHYMSHLGNSVLNPKGAIFFNLGCIISGSLLFPFFIGLYEWYIGGNRNKKLTQGTQIAGFFSAFGMIMIGVFTEDTIVLHVIFAVFLFFVNIFTLLLPALALYQFSFTKKIAKFAYIAVGINITLMFVFIPIIEWVTISISFSFILLLIQNMNKRIDKYRFIRKSGIELPPTKRQRMKKKKAKAKASKKAT